MRTILATFILVAVASIAFAFTGVLPTDNAAKPVQNVKGIAPIPAASKCTTVTGRTKGTIVTQSTKDSAGKSYLGLKWAAVDATGAAINVKRKLNSNTAYMPDSKEEITLTPAITQVSFDLFSSATAKTATVCTDFQ